jgi:hypothetical protein
MGNREYAASSSGNLARAWGRLCPPHFYHTPDSDFHGLGVNRAAMLEKGVDAEAEARCYGAEESEEYENEAAEIAEVPMSSLLRSWSSLPVRQEGKGSAD